LFAKNSLVFSKWIVFVFCGLSFVKKHALGTVIP
jgi:hypothetical protein